MSSSKDQEKNEQGVTQFQEKGRPLQEEEFNTAFYGHLPDGSLAFRTQYNDQFMQHQRADLQKSGPIIRHPGCPRFSGCGGSVAGGTRWFGQQTRYPVSRTQMPPVSRGCVWGRCEKTEVVKDSCPGIFSTYGSIGSWRWPARQTCGDSIIRGAGRIG